MGDKSHWEKVYGTKAETEVSWYQPHATKSIQFIESTGLGRGAGIIDIGGGASTLVDDLLERGYEHLTVLDISHLGLQSAQRRLGNQKNAVTWLEADITRVGLPRRAYDIWHDRAVFHFLASAEDRRHYVQNLRGTLRGGGVAVMATFGPEGPLKCSGLEVVRYSAGSLHKELGNSFELVKAESEEHPTPSGNLQKFIYACFRLKG